MDLLPGRRVWSGQQGVVNITVNIYIHNYSCYKKALVDVDFKTLKKLSVHKAHQDPTIHMVENPQVKSMR